jgi:hypothetical protein
MPPLKPIHRPQIPHLSLLQPNTIEVLSRPIPVPNFNPPLTQVHAIGIRADKPEEFLDDGPEKDSLGGEQGEAVVAQREAELGGRKEGEGSCACSVRTEFSVGEDVFDEV